MTYLADSRRMTVASVSYSQWIENWNYYAPFQGWDRGLNGYVD